MDELLAAFDGADAVLHLSAAQPHSRPVEDLFGANVKGTMNVFDVALRCGVRKVVNWSSIWALGWSEPGNEFIPDYLPIDEGHPLRATDAYGQSKIEGEAIAESFHGRDGLQALTLRPVYTALPATLAKLWSTKGVKNPTYSHLAYVDVRDQARAARRTLEVRNESYTVVNLAADDSRVAEPLRELLPRLHPPIGDRAEQLTGVRSSISNDRARQLLDWSPHYSWRSLSTPQRVRGYATQSVRSAAEKLVPAGAKELMRGRNR
jgi:nucleoside-diphosphate-sugar epimerase